MNGCENATVGVALYVGRAPHPARMSGRGSGRQAAHALEALTAREFTQARLLGVTGAPLTLASGAVGVEIIECVWDHAPRCTVGSKVLHKPLCWKRPVTVTVRAVQRAALKNVP